MSKLPNIPCLSKTFGVNAAAADDDDEVTEYIYDTDNGKKSVHMMCDVNHVTAPALRRRGVKTAGRRRRMVG